MPAPMGPAPRGPRHIGLNEHARIVWEAVTGAVQSLRGSKLRSFMTLPGIILASTTLIAVMSVISGMDVYIAQNVSNMGADGYRITRIVDDAVGPRPVRHGLTNAGLLLQRLRLQLHLHPGVRADFQFLSKRLRRP
jgi:ABC-type lipoprotein release transport system permease subunit